MSLRVFCISKVKSLSDGAVGKPSRVNSALVPPCGVHKLMQEDPKPSELTMGRVKSSEERMEARTGVGCKLLG